MKNQIHEFFLRLCTFMVLFLYFGGSYYVSKYIFYGALSIVCLLMLIVEWPRLVDRSYRWVTVFFPVLPMVSLFYLVYQFYDVDVVIPLVPFVLSWTADTCGYLVGKLLGFHKIWPSISPGKSWEGLWGSFVGVVIVSTFLLSYVHLPVFHALTFYWPILLCFSALITLMALNGGMLMSWLKRRKGLKDTASWLPGHGGFLDRFDSVFFVAPTIVAIIFFWMHVH